MLTRIVRISDFILRELNLNSVKLSYLKTLCHYSGTTKQELKGLMSESNGRASGEHTTGNPVRTIDGYSKANNHKNKRITNINFIGRH